MNEAQEQKQLLNWVKIQYPNLLYTEDLGGIKLTIGQAVQVKKSRARRGHPDLMFQKVFKDSYGQVIFCGLAIEFKRKGEQIVKKDGELRKNTHLKEQYDYLLALRKESWFTCFAVGFLEAQDIIKTYMSNDIDQLDALYRIIFPDGKLNLA
jgi:hypothetical protein